MEHRPKMSSVSDGLDNQTQRGYTSTGVDLDQYEGFWVNNVSDGECFVHDHMDFFYSPTYCSEINGSGYSSYSCADGGGRGTCSVFGIRGDGIGTCSIDYYGEIDTHGGDGYGANEYDYETPLRLRWK